MTIEFKPAKRHAISLLLGVCGPSGGGKTVSGMRLAAGLSGGKRFCVIDTENGRASYYADDYSFDVFDLHAPFSPDRYLEAIQAADAAGYPVIMTDSFSHEWFGEGGCLDMQEAELKRMAGDDYAKRERVKLAAWIKPKMAHKRMMAKLLQVRAHVILCFRAEEKIEIIKKPNGKTEIVPKASLTGINGWVPIAEKSAAYELTLSVLLLPDRPGVPLPIKMMGMHRPFFPEGQPITEEAGAKLAAWAAGDDAPKPNGNTAARAPETSSEPPSDDAALPGVDDLIVAYGECDSVERFQSLEGSRRLLWDNLKGTGAGPLKTRLRTASQQAKERVGA